MKILYAASEAAPYAKSGGLADVAGALPKALVRDGIDCRVIMPLYGDLKFKDTLTYVTNFSVPVGWRSQYCGLFKTERNGVTYYFLDNEYYFKRRGLYGFYDDGERFAFFCRAVTELLHKRMTEIVQGVAAAYRCTAEITFSDYCPCMVVDTPLAKNALTYMTELLGRGAMDMTVLTGGKPGGGSEDFAFVSHEVPTVSMFLTAGNANEGYTYGQHHPKVKFDDSVLFEGSAAYAYMALRWLQEHK